MSDSTTRYFHSGARNPVGNPYRYGFADAVMGRESDCPWKGAHNFTKQAKYLKGYLAGSESAAKHGLNVEKRSADNE